MYRSMNLVGNLSDCQLSRDLDDSRKAESSRSAEPTNGKNRASVTSLDGDLHDKGTPADIDSWKAIWRWDIRTDTTVWSEQLYRIIGRENVTIPPFREHFRFYTSESWIRLVDATLELLKTGAPYALRLQMLHSDGSRRWVICQGEAVGNEQGETVELRGTVQDITRWVSQSGRAELIIETESKAEDATRRLIQAQEEENARLAIKFRDNICERLALLAARIQSFRSAFSDLLPQPGTEIEPLWQETAGTLRDLDLREPGSTEPRSTVVPGFND